MSHERSHLVKLPSKSQAGADIFASHRRISDQIRPIRVLGNPVLHQGVVFRQERFLLGREFVTDGTEFLDDGRGLVFGNGPAPEKTNAVSVQEIKRPGLERAEDPQTLRRRYALA